MLKLVVYPPSFGEPSASPFSMKAICLMQMSGLEWKRSSTADPRKAPKSKLPVLVDGDKTIPDSEQIKEYLQAKSNIDFDKGLTNEQIGVSRALIRMVEEHLYFALVCDRWANDANWAIIREEFFGKIPRLIKGFVTKQVRKQAIGQAYNQGMGRHSDAERFDRAKKDVDAIVAVLGDHPFLFGDKPTAADASVVPALRAISVMPVATQLSDYVNANEVLMAYMDRGSEAMYPKT